MNTAVDGQNAKMSIHPAIFLSNFVKRMSNKMLREK